MYEAIDSTSMGDIPWKSFTLEYNSVQPEDDIPSGMIIDCDAWFQNPWDLVCNMISNPNFEDKFDYTLLQEYTTNGVL